MRVFCCGSANLDLVYRVPHFVRDGETLAATRREVFCGGKGLNQAIALSRAGADVSFIGRVGSDGGMLMERLQSEGIDASLSTVADGPTGHAVIQVTEDGDNSILLFSGANHSFKPGDEKTLLANCQAGDVLVLQNEISCVDSFIKEGRSRGMVIVFTPSPMLDEVKSYALGAIDYLFVNERELAQLSGHSKVEPGLKYLERIMPTTEFVATLGERGAVHLAKGQLLTQEAYPTEVVDSTAAGDTFLGFFMAGVLKGWSREECMKWGAKAAALCVARAGAADAIPHRNELGVDTK